MLQFTVYTMPSGTMEYRNITQFLPVNCLRRTNKCITPIRLDVIWCHRVWRLLRALHVKKIDNSSY